MCTTFLPDEHVEDTTNAGIEALLALVDDVLLADKQRSLNFISVVFDWTISVLNEISAKHGQRRFIANKSSDEAFQVFIQCASIGSLLDLMKKSSELL